MSVEYYLPKATSRLLTEARLKQCNNLGLLLDKYPPQGAIDRNEEKSSWLKRLLQEPHSDMELAKAVYERWHRVTTAMAAQHFTAMTAWRLAVGLGGETVLEIDLTLHHIYGIPFIPGSALKGLTRAYLVEEIYAGENIANNDPIVQRIFGTQEKAGSVIFFDAMPFEGKFLIDLDIMNAHYPRYYAEKELPTSSQRLNPLPFLTVKDTTFAFAIAPRQPEDSEHITLVVEWLQAALQAYGVGGKTSAGYGYFKP